MALFGVRISYPYGQRNDYPKPMRCTYEFRRYDSNVRQMLNPRRYGHLRQFKRHYQ